MGVSDSSQDLWSEVEVDALRRIFPLGFFEHHLSESLRPDGRPLGKARDTIVKLGLVSSANGSALAKIGSTTMLASITMEVMTPCIDSPDQGCIALEFHMPPICSPTVETVAPVISKRLSDTILSCGMFDLNELCLVSGKAAWMCCLDIHCLDADGALFDAALLSAVAAFSNLQIPLVALNDNGRIVAITGEKEEHENKEAVNKEKRKLMIKNIPFSLTCILHKNYILPDPTAEEESIMDTLVTVVLDSSDQMVSFYKSGGNALAYSSAIKSCVELARERAKELKQILGDL
ncbi:hypothetical protein AALP_AA3G114300 [Arabis alpina]|uniref:Ribosomal RNA-processing protein 43 n=1 Tax=Arabis alpina TaxID=50452 RepID=A0A087H8J2_ARAAL|nr:hypothetical protein AALP_AA3G114300 [Arabis alpina]